MDECTRTQVHAHSHTHTHTHAHTHTHTHTQTHSVHRGRHQVIWKADAKSLSQQIWAERIRDDFRPSFLIAFGLGRTYPGIYPGYVLPRLNFVTKSKSKAKNRHDPHTAVKSENSGHTYSKSYILLNSLTTSNISLLQSFCDQIWWQETLPPGCVSYLLCSLIKQPRGSGHPWKDLYQVLRGGSSSSWVLE